jgi:hypothetical protein
MRKSSAFFVAAAAGFVLAAGTASANTYCVSDASCVSAGGKDEGANLQTGITDAAVHPGADRVQVGAGTFATAPYLYSDPSPTNPVTLVGAGKGNTKLSMPQQDNAAVLTLRGPSTVSDLEIDMPNSATGDLGLNLVDAGATASRILVAGAGNSATGVNLAGATLDHSTVTFAMQTSNTAVRSANTPGATIADDDLTGFNGIYTKDPAGTVKVVRTRVRAGGNGITQLCGPISVEDSLIDERTAPNYVGFYAYSDACAKNANNLALLRHVTIVGGAPKGVGIYAPVADPAVTRNIAVTDSVIAGFPNAVLRQAFSGTANVALDHSSYDAATIKSTNQAPGTGSVGETAPIGVPTGFVDSAAGDFHLLAGSPLVDAGNPNGLGAGESATDLDGNDRIADGNNDGTARSDVGAFERPGPPAPASPPSPPAPPSTPAPSQPASTESSDPATGEGAPSDSKAPRPGPAAISRP